MRQVVVKDKYTGFNKIYHACDYCGHPHPNIPFSGICRRCHRKSNI